MRELIEMVREEMNSVDASDSKEMWVSLTQMSMLTLNSLSDIIKLYLDGDDREKLKAKIGEAALGIIAITQIYKPEIDNESFSKNDRTIEQSISELCGEGINIGVVGDYWTAPLNYMNMAMDNATSIAFGAHIKRWNLVNSNSLTFFSESMHALAEFFCKRGDARESLRECLQIAIDKSEQRRF